MKRRDSIKAKQHPETNEFLHKNINVLEEFLDRGAELFSFPMIVESTKEHLNGCFPLRLFLKVKYITGIYYVFSSDNWKKPRI